VYSCCHPSFCAAYTTGVELALAGPLEKTAPASSVPSRIAPASSLLAIVDVLATELSPRLELPVVDMVPVSCPPVLCPPRAAPARSASSLSARSALREPSARQRSRQTQPRTGPEPRVMQDATEGQGAARSPKG